MYPSSVLSTDEWHDVVQENRRILQERFDQARQAKAEVVDALNAENVPAEEQQVNKHE